MSADRVASSRPLALVDVLDRLLNVGVVLQGDLMLSVADVDLLYVGLKLVVCSVDRLGLPPYEERRPKPPAPFPAPAPPALALAVLRSESNMAPSGDAALPEAAGSTEPPPQPLPPQDLPAKSETSARGLAQLVLALVELLRDLMERQAIQRMEHGTIDEAQIEQLGQTFQQISQRMDELKAFFDLSDDDLNLDLGPLGRLLD